MLVVAMCDGHAVNRSSQNGGARPPSLHQQPQQSQEDGPLAALARCGALAAAGNGCSTVGKPIQRPPPPPARAAPGRPTAPPPPPPPTLPPNGIGRRLCGMRRVWRSTEPVEHVCVRRVLSVTSVDTLELLSD